MASLATSSHKPHTGLRHAQSLENVSYSATNTQKKQWPTVNENCPIHSPRSKCTCTSFVKNNQTDGMGSNDSLHRSGDFGQQYPDKNDNLNSSSIRPYNNNPPLPTTQRDIIGNNLQFSSSSLNKDWMDDENDQLAALLMYRDNLKKSMTTQNRFSGAFPRMRCGRVGSQWRHIKSTNTYSGSNLMFIDGTVRIDDSIKFPIPRFGYPPMRRPQHKFSSSYNDLTAVGTQSLDASNWAATDALQRRPSLNRYSNQFQRHAKENFTYWPTDSAQKKSQCETYNPGTYKTWFELNNAGVRI